MFPRDQLRHAVPLLRNCSTLARCEETFLISTAISYYTTTISVVSKLVIVVNEDAFSDIQGNQLEVILDRLFHVGKTILSIAVSKSKDITAECCLS